MERRLDTVKKILDDGEVKVWGKKYLVSWADLEEIDFSLPKWTGVIFEAMANLHAKTNVTPRSLQFASSQEKESAAQIMFSSVKRRVLEQKNTNQE